MLAGFPAGARHALVHQPAQNRIPIVGAPPAVTSHVQDQAPGLPDLVEYAVKLPYDLIGPETREIHIDNPIIHLPALKLIRLAVELIRAARECDLGFAAVQSDDIQDNPGAGLTAQQSVVGVKIARVRCRGGDVRIDRLQEDLSHGSAVDMRNHVTHLDTGRLQFLPQLLTSHLLRRKDLADDRFILYRPHTDGRLTIRLVTRTPHIRVTVPQESHTLPEHVVVLHVGPGRLHLEDILEQNTIPIDLRNVVEEGEVVLDLTPQACEPGNALGLRYHHGRHRPKSSAPLVRST
jgi:hypothetical protein